MAAHIDMDTDHRHQREDLAHGTFKTYVLGFVLSLALSAVAFLFLQEHMWTGHRVFTHEFLYGEIIVLATAQLIVQLYFFLHLGKGTSARMNAVILAFAFTVLVILVGGTLWIMSNLRHDNMPQMFEDGIVAPQMQMN